jgi:sugar (pentulose or hexulose) kinase
VAGLLVGIDVGTSSCKVAVVDLEGGERAVARVTMPWRPGRAGAELWPHALQATVHAAVGQALDGIDDGTVLGVGVASMAEAGFLLDGRGQPLGPTVAWHDERAGSELGALEADLPDFVVRTGLRRTARAPALRVRRQVRRSQLPAGAARWLHVAEYLVYVLGGDPVTEPSLASRTGWLDVDELRWWDDALAWSGVDRRLLPELRPAGSRAGLVRSAGALSGAALTVAGHDHLSAAVGAGALDLDAVVDSCGTAEVVLRATGPLRAPHRRRTSDAGFTSGRHVLPGRFALVGGFPSGALLDEVVRVGRLAGPADADARAADHLPPAEVPTPEELLAAVRELRSVPSPAEVAVLWRQAVEAVGRRSGQLFRELVALTGPSGSVLTVGGSADASLVADARARHLGRMERPDVTEAAARGAALAAGVAAGVFSDLAAVPCPPRRPVDVERPA